MKRTPLKRRTPLRHTRKPPKPRHIRERFDRLKKLGCIVCKDHYGLWTWPQVHHIREGHGYGQRAPHEETIPLCEPGHHITGGESVHGGYETFVAKFGTERELLARVNELLGVR